MCTKGGMVAIVTSAKCEGGIHTNHITTMSFEVHTTFCVQIGGKSRVACECVVSRGQSSFVRYEHFACWSGRYEHYRRLKRAVWTLSPFEAGGMNISPDFDAKAQLTACNATFSARLDTKNIFFWFKYSTGKNLRNNLSNFINLNDEHFFFKLKKIFLWIPLRKRRKFTCENFIKSCIEIVKIHYKNAWKWTWIWPKNHYERLGSFSPWRLR